MKTAISIPDETFADAEDQAAALGITRSEFFTRAVRCYIEHLHADSLTERIDAALELAGEDDSGQAAVAAGRRRLVATGNEW